MIQAPKFIESEFFVDTFGDWSIKPEAPEEVIREFNEFMRTQEENNDKGIDL